MTARENKMTDDELRELVASIAISQKETDKQLRETDKQLNEFQIESWKQIKENRNQLKELGKQIGGLGRKFGSFTEGLALPGQSGLN